MESQSASWNVDLDRTERIMAAGSVLGFLVAALGVVGDVLGWWDFWGGVLINVGTIAGLLLGLATAMRSSSRAQVRGVSEQLDGIDGKLDQLDRLGHVEDHLARQTEILVQIRDRL